MVVPLLPQFPAPSLLLSASSPIRCEAWICGYLVLFRNVFFSFLLVVHDIAEQDVHVLHCAQHTAIPTF